MSSVMGSMNHLQCSTISRSSAPDRRYVTYQIGPEGPPLSTSVAIKLIQTPATLNHCPFSTSGRISSFSGKTVCPRAGLLISHSPWYRRIQTYTCRQAQEREINLTTAFSSRESAEDYTLRQRRGESSQVHGDQTGRDGGTKKVKEENGPLDDLDQNEDARGCCQPLFNEDKLASD